MADDYWIENEMIRGPTNDLCFRINGGYIFGPRSSGKYWISNNGYLYGPTEGGKWRVELGRFTGPDGMLPFMKSTY